jgi:hypothetical protein
MGNEEQQQLSIPWKTCHEIETQPWDHDRWGPSQHRYENASPGRTAQLQIAPQNPSSVLGQNGLIRLEKDPAGGVCGRRSGDGAWRRRRGDAAGRRRGGERHHRQLPRRGRPRLRPLPHHPRVRPPHHSRRYVVTPPPSTY